MDHFYLDECNQHAPEIVPFLTTITPYQDGEWAEFPQRVGYPPEFYRLVRQDSGCKHEGPYMSPQQFLALLQEWLFFGTLIEWFRIFGLDVSRDDFVIERAGKRWLYTGGLADLCKQIMWKNCNESVPVEPLSEEKLYTDVINEFYLQKQPAKVARTMKLQSLGRMTSRTLAYTLGIDTDTLALQTQHKHIARETKDNQETSSRLTHIYAMLERTSVFIDRADRHLNEADMAEVAASSHMLACTLLIESLEEMTERILQRTMCLPVLGSLRSHALGNPTANALPQCQLERLSRLAAAVDGEATAFWIDTLLVPLGQPLRQKTISMMVRIYKESRAMIVIDRDLSFVEGIRTHRVMHVLLSDWSTRLWTFQEGMLCSDRTHFAFKDRLVSLWELDMGLGYLSTLPELLSVRSYWLRLGEYPEARRDAAPGDLLKLVSTVHKRATTKPWDEAICLATLLGYDVLALPLKPKFEDLLKLTGLSIPEDLIFLKGPRCELRGYRWAPRTVLNTGLGNIVVTTAARNRLTSLGPKGIQIVKDVCCIGDVTIQVGQKPYMLIQPSAVSDVAEAAYMITLANDRDDTMEARVLRNAAFVWTSTSELALQEWAIAGMPAPAIIISNLHKDEDNELCGHYETDTCILFDKTFLGTSVDKLPTLERTIAHSYTLWVD
ncbi:hypothetical protein LTS10_001188 [Elasticomyces elasticus]|nr:hypothetical protein LTS10_001188 [Elasticomyces elasticus]